MISFFERVYLTVTHHSIFVNHKNNLVITMIKLTSILFEETKTESGKFGPVYHGGNWDGKTPIKVTGRGALGSGAYFTPIKQVAEEYANQSGGKIIEAYLDIKKPLEIHMGKNRYEHPCVMALVQLGMPEEKAQNKVEKIEELKGYVGKEISSAAAKQGYDAIFQYFNGILREVVIWDSSKVFPAIDQE
jgi:hypothetical protein